MILPLLKNLSIQEVITEFSRTLNPFNSYWGLHIRFLSLNAP